MNTAQDRRCPNERRARTGPRPAAPPHRAGLADAQPTPAARGFVFAAAATLLPWAIWSLGEIDHTSAEALGFGLFIVLSRLALLMAGIGLFANGAVVVRLEGIRIATIVAPAAGLGAAFLREFVAFLALHRRTNIVLSIALTAPAVLAAFA
ncbi:hypothetical protein ABIA39_004747 [Nocardia sp. GAS34]|uniref:hypothetical protein n=1 Tax=unclassified Nocardia TaxID=2637762 RepID=UPI003D1EBE5E